jgi:hypothetical protein
MKEDVEGKVQHKEISSEDIIGLYEVCFSEYGWDWETTMEMPIPVFLETIEALKRRKELEMKHIKKKGK